MTQCPECASDVPPFPLAETSYHYCLQCSHQWPMEEEEETPETPPPTGSGLWGNASSQPPYENSSPPTGFFGLPQHQYPSGSPYQQQQLQAEMQPHHFQQYQQHQQQQARGASVQQNMAQQQRQESMLQQQTAMMNYVLGTQLPAGQPEALIESVGSGLAASLRGCIGLPPNTPAPEAPKPPLQHWSTRVGRL